MHVGERIHLLMKERGISQNRLAKLAQMSQSGLSSIINGYSSPKENTLQLIANALQCSVSDLLDEQQPPARTDEDEILFVWRQLSDAGKSIVLATARATLQQEGMRQDGFISSTA